MIVSLTQYASLAKDIESHPLPLGDERIACQVRTSAGTFAALDARCRFVRLATDTAIHMDVDGGSTTSADDFFPAGTIEFISVDGGEVLTIATA